MLQRSADRILLNLAGRDVQRISTHIHLKNHLSALERHHQVVAGKRDVLNLDVATVDNCGDSAITPELTRGTMPKSVRGSINLNFRHVNFFPVVDNGVAF